MSKRTLIVCTVLTGIREIAMLEKIWPPTWKSPMGNVAWMISFVGFLNFENRTSGDMNRMQ